MKNAAVSLALMFSAFTVIGGVVGGSKAARAVESAKISTAAPVDCNAASLSKAQQLQCLY